MTAERHDDQRRLLLAPGGRHPDGLVYEFENVDVENGRRPPPAVGETLLERLQQLAGKAASGSATIIDSGEPITSGTATRR